MSDASPPPLPPAGSLRGDGGRGARRLGEILLQRGWIDAGQLASALAEQAHMDLVDPTAVALDLELIERVTLAFIRRHRALPLRRDEAGRVLVAIDDPGDHRGLEALAGELGCPVDPVLAPGPALDSAIEAAEAGLEERRGAEELAEPDPSLLAVPSPPPELAPMVRGLGDDPAWGELLGALLARIPTTAEADRLRILSWPERGVAQLRVDARWTDLVALEGAVADSSVIGLGAVLELDPEFGLSRALGGALGGRTVLGRILEHGGAAELSLRLQSTDPARELAGLGFDEEVQRRLRQWTASREGVVLVTGGPRSGRSTSLRALAANLSRHRDVVFVGEPPGPTGPRLRFVDDTGLEALTEALALRPRVLVVDDISDPELARVVLAAGERRSLVLAGLRGHDAHDALQTLRAAGVPDPLLGASLLGVVEQRLIPTLCPDCRSHGSPDPTALRILGLSGAAVPQAASRGAGCEGCAGSGVIGWTMLATRVELGGGLPSGCSAADLRGLVDRARPTPPSTVALDPLRRGDISLSGLAQALAAPPPRPAVQAQGGGYVPGMPEETVERPSPLPAAASLDQLLDLDPDPDADDRHVLLLFDPNDSSYQGLSAILPHDRCRIVAASEWADVLEIVRRERPTAVLLPAAPDPVATRGRIRAFRNDLTSAFLPICVLVPPGTDPQPLREAGADEVLPVTGAAGVRSGLLALIDRVT